jgi:acetylornithine deacetylase/succinyl-diaminopimelate desuccinylase-like protein
VRTVPLGIAITKDPDSIQRLTAADLILETRYSILIRMYSDLTTAVHTGFPRARAELEELVRIPSVSAPGFDPEQVRRSARKIASFLETSGFEDVHLLQIEGAHPAVYGEIPAPAGAPTVLLYAHHDVQPPGPDDEWDSAPFEPIERDGRLLGRGTADDKCGVVMHLAAVRAFDGDVPVGVKIFMEGEEEIGSANLGAYLAQNRDLLEADVIVIGDAGNWRVGVPALTTSLRGLVDCTIEVRTLENAIHSGMFGGPIPDAITVMSRVIASLHDDDGNVAVPGLASGTGDGLDLTEAELRRQTGTVEGLRLIGDGDLTDRIWLKPAIAVLAVDAPPIHEAINQLVPVARAKISMRIVPGQDPQTALDALVTHLESSVPWGAQITVTPGTLGAAIALEADDDASLAFKEAFGIAYGNDTVEIGMGGSIPFVAAFREAYPDASILLTGVMDPESRIHGPNESQSLADLEHGILGEAIALRMLAD